MKNKAYLFLAILLTGSCFVIFYLLIGLPAVPVDLILNEKSYLEFINENEYQTVLRKKARIAGEGSTSPRVLIAREQANVMAEWTTAFYQDLNETRASYNNVDSARRGLSHLSGALGKVLHLGDSSEFPSEFLGQLHLESKILDPRLPDRAKAHLGLPYLLLQNDFLVATNATMDSLQSVAEAVNLKFDVLTNIKSNEGPAWVTGQIVFNPPGSMNLYQKERVQVRISKKYSDEISASMTRKEDLVSDSLAVGDIMLVKLMGEDFDIVAYDDEEQGVTQEGYTQWEFDVTPKSSGNHDLYIKAGIMYYVPNLGPAKKYFPVYEKVIQVEVSTWQLVAGFATTRWEFLLSTIIIPLGAWGFSRLRGKRKS